MKGVNVAGRLLALAALVVCLGAARAAASEFEVVATSLTVDNQVNASSVAYFGGKTLAPASPALANLDPTLFPTPGGLYFDGTYYKVWNNVSSQWVQLTTGTYNAQAGVGAVGGSGTAGYVTRWTASGTAGNSAIQDNGTNVSLGQAPTGDVLSVGGSGTVNFNNTGGYVAVLGMTVAKSGTVTTLYSGTGTATPIAKIK